MRETDAWLPDLAPPPGGLSRLRESVRAPRRQRGVAWSVAAAAASVAVVAVVLLPVLLQQYRARENLAEVVRQAVQTPGPGGLRMIDGAAVALESRQAGVKLYLVQPVRVNTAASQH